jgi:hypothetical protein
VLFKRTGTLLDGGSIRSKYLLSETDNSINDLGIYFISTDSILSETEDDIEDGDSILLEAEDYVEENSWIYHADWIAGRYLLLNNGRERKRLGL